ncbi:hypothetical protein B5M47_00890 [candidate division CPR3 bacterium 4484_211]|uniref:Uncharacterized protein n=1 Tax=candidate division CPR3 bacterium 4484_211 TaxID=1968527 RepID=A0A1W9NZ33_UNCC3|nr:MAG: hypothetical protein B5M47_00890 [candidate division CPR3 bacterium 4484_211]
MQKGLVFITKLSLLFFVAFRNLHLSLLKPRWTNSTSKKFASRISFQQYRPKKQPPLFGRLPAFFSILFLFFSLYFKSIRNLPLPLKAPYKEHENNGKEDGKTRHRPLLGGD